MTHTPHTSTTRDDARPTVGEMLAELIDLSAGAGAALLPALLLAVPGIILFVVLPALLLLAVAAPLAVIGAVIAGPPYLLARWLRRRRRRIDSPSAGRPGRAPRSARTSPSQVRDLGAV
jgi:Flp pilus assembly protein TadB